MKFAQIVGTVSYRTFLADTEGAVRNRTYFSYDVYLPSRLETV